VVPGGLSTPGSGVFFRTSLGSCFATPSTVLLGDPPPPPSARTTFFFSTLFPVFRLAGPLREGFLPPAEIFRLLGRAPLLPFFGQLWAPTPHVLGKTTLPVLLWFSPAPAFLVHCRPI